MADDQAQCRGDGHQDEGDAPDARQRYELDHGTYVGLGIAEAIERPGRGEQGNDIFQPSEGRGRRDNRQQWAVGSYRGTQHQHRRGKAERLQDKETRRYGPRQLNARDVVRPHVQAAGEPAGGGGERRDPASPRRCDGERR